MAETSLDLSQLIADLGSGKGVIVGGRGQTTDQMTQTIAALSPAIQTVVDESRATFGQLALHVAENMKAGFMLQPHPPLLRISVSEWHPGSVTLAQLTESPTSNAAWNRYRVQARAVVPPDFSRRTQTEHAAAVADHERTHAAVFAEHGIPFIVGIDVTPHGIGGHVKPRTPNELIPPIIQAEVYLAPMQPSEPDLWGAAAALLTHQGTLDELTPVIEAPGFPSFAYGLEEAVDMARHTILGSGDGTNPDNPPFIGDHNRERLFGGLHTPSAANDPAVDWLRNQFHQSLGK